MMNNFKYKSTSTRSTRAVTDHDEKIDRILFPFVNQSQKMKELNNNKKRIQKRVKVLNSIYIQL